MSTGTTQEARILELTTPLGKDVLLIESFTGTERISGLFEFQLKMRSSNKSIDPDAIITKGVTVKLELPRASDEEKVEHRFFHGMVVRFGKTGQGSDNATYTADVVPWLALLTKTADCRVFQDVTIPDVINKVFDEWKQEYSNLVEFEDKTDSSKYRPLDYCVQYRETDFAFVTRLMAQEGIFYYFKHEDGKHTCVFGDDPDDHLPCPVNEKVRFEGDEGEEFTTPEDNMLLTLLTKGGDLLKSQGGSAAQQAEQAVLSQLGSAILGILTMGISWIFSGVQKLLELIIDAIIDAVRKEFEFPAQKGVKVMKLILELRPGQYTLRDHHFQMPSKTLQFSEVTNLTVGDNDKLEIYDYPGEYAKRFDKPDERLDEVEDEGKKLVKLRMQEEETPHAPISGVSRDGIFTAGHRFELTNHPDNKVNGNYILTQVEHSVVQSTEYRSDNENIVKLGGPYRNKFTCIPQSLPFRPARPTPKPVVQGPQTAVVVGPENEEIFVDKFGRIKVQFHWDRIGEKNENSSCFLRVAQLVAGKRWGASFWPRIGQEVVVSFLEGDPDRPLVVGTLYNAEQMPPYLGDGPDGEHTNNPNLSGVKTCSTRGGKGFNELRFDDTKGDEQVFIQAERDMDQLVWNECRELVHNKRHLMVGGIDPDSRQLRGEQREIVIQDKHVAVLQHQSEHIAGNMELLVGGTRDRYAAEAPGEFAHLFAPVPGGGNLHLAITGSKMESIGGEHHLKVRADRLEKIDGTQSLDVGGDQLEKVGGGHALEATKIHLKAASEIVLEAGATVCLKCGGSFVTLTPGSVAISGAAVLINSGGSAMSATSVAPPAPKGAKQAEPAFPDIPAETENAKSGFPSAPDATEAEEPFHGLAVRPR